jgi:hypothetical protein
MKFSPLIAFVVLLPLAAQTYEPLTAGERLKWFGRATYGPRSLLASGPITAGWRTLTNRPEEWGPGWEGFGKRYGSRLVNNSVTNGLEGSFGAIWKEDPRYFRIGEGSMGKRLGGVVKRTWMSRYGNGEYHFGAAKFIGITGGSLFQKAWMPDSVTSNRDVVNRIWGGYAGRLVGNFIREFTPDLMRKFKKKN